MSSRDNFAVVDLSKGGAGKGESLWFCQFWKTIESPVFKPRDGFVRGKALSGLVGVDGAVTFLLNFDLAGEFMS